MAAKLTALQFFFALTWVIYVIYLPALAAQAGIPQKYVAWILMLDQAIFMVCDWAMGVHADRLAKTFGRVGQWMAGMTIASCVAFVAMPFVAPSASGPLFVALAAIWSATSSALRAPPLVIAARYAEAERRPWISSFYLFGLGLASALAPFIALAMKGVDPRIPFALASIGLALFAFVAARSEAGSVPRTHEASSTLDAGPGGVVLFALAALCLGIGLQVHIAINSVAAYLRFTSSTSLPSLLPLFWVGFSLAVLPAALLPKRFGGLRTMALGALAGAVALFAAEKADSLETLIAAQVAAGAAWAVALSAGVTAAVEIGQPDRTGWMTGLLFSLLAAAALARFAAVSSGVTAGQGLGAVAMPGWIVAAVIGGFLATRVREGRA